MTLKVADQFLSHDVGVIVGRFQVHKLHSEHIDLIRTVQERHKRTIILLGFPPTKVTRRNPLDFQMRRQMIQDAFPTIDDIYYVEDQPDDKAWSKLVDREIGKHIAGERTAVLYGSRDSFVPHYHGKYPVCELEPNRIVSGSELRQVAANQRRASEDFRAGVIYAVEQGYTHAWPTIDVAILDDTCAKILLGRKRTDPAGMYRFPGGFVRTKFPGETITWPRAGILERNARAEASEETHSELSTPRYVGNAVIDDWRYRGDDNEILTILFAAKHLFGPLRADDDLDEIRWFAVSDLDAEDFPMIVPGHRVLMEMLLNWLEAGNQP